MPEFQVAMMLAQGKSKEDISSVMSLSTKTLSTYRRRIYQKCHIANDVELLYLAIKEQMIETTTNI